jgi:hypothetical protein
MKALVCILEGLDVSTKGTKVKEGEEERESERWSEVLSEMWTV